jgi:hypothetical protein
MASAGTGAGQSLSALSTALTVLLPICAVASLIFAAALFNRADLLDDPLNASFTEAEDADNAVAGGIVIFFLATLATGVVWVIWQFRHAKNARALGQPSGELGPGWAIGGWFIPLASWVLPQLQLMQAAKASDPTGRRSVPPLVFVWWGLWAAGGLLFLISGRFGGEELDGFATQSDIEDFQSADQMAALGSLVLAAAAIAGMLLVRTLSARQQAALRARGQLPG